MKYCYNKITDLWKTKDLSPINTNLSCQNEMTASYSNYSDEVVNT